VKVVVDTNVVAYYLLKTEPFFDEVRAFWRRVTEPMAPASWQVELANALWVTTRSGIIDAAGALERLRLASRLGMTSVDATLLWAGAVSRSLTADHPVYDTLFVELAARENVPLATYDKRLLATFDRVARRPDEL
jgi:predicted nucleic acid-binding protein